MRPNRDDAAKRASQAMRKGAPSDEVERSRPAPTAESPGEREMPGYGYGESSGGPEEPAAGYGESSGAPPGSGASYAPPTERREPGGESRQADELADEPISDLMKRLSTQMSTLVRQELKLAQTELQEKGKRAGIGAGLFGGSGIVALYAVGALLAAVIMLLGTAIEPWLSALIVAVALALVAGALALVGKKQVEQATPPAPEQAVESVQEDVEYVKERARR
jgi:membrane protein